jgi:hypothetical protein
MAHLSVDNERIDRLQFYKYMVDSIRARKLLVLYSVDINDILYCTHPTRHRFIDFTKMSAKTGDGSLWISFDTSSGDAYPF